MLTLYFPILPLSAAGEPGPPNQNNDAGVNDALRRSSVPCAKLKALTVSYCRSKFLHEQTHSNGSRKTLLVKDVTVEEYAE